MKLYSLCPYWANQSLSSGRVRRIKVRDPRMGKHFVSWQAPDGQRKVKVLVGWIDPCRASIVIRDASSLSHCQLSLPCRWFHAHVTGHQARNCSWKRARTAASFADPVKLIHAISFFQSGASEHAYKVYIVSSTHPLVFQVPVQVSYIHYNNYHNLAI